MYNKNQAVKYGASSQWLCRGSFLLDVSVSICIRVWLSRLTALGNSNGLSRVWLALSIITAALLGTPASKTLRSATPEFVRGLRQFCVTVGSGSYAKACMDMNFQAITRRLMKVPDRYISGSTESIGQGH